MANIRAVELNDMPAVIELCALHATYEGARFSKHGKQQKLATAFLHEPQSAYCLVAEIDHQIVGYATATKEFSTWDADYYLHMDCLYIKEQHRGGGLGRRFIEKIKDLATSLGCAQVQWQTPSDNSQAIAFYHAQHAHSKDKKRFFLDI